MHDGGAPPTPTVRPEAFSSEFDVLPIATAFRIPGTSLDAVGPALAPGEVERLAFSVQLMAYEFTPRFLADHLAGDAYFRVHREGRNLDRARTQNRLAADLEAKRTAVEDIVRNLLGVQCSPWT